MAEEKPKEKTKCPTAKKRDIQNEKKALQNKSFKSKVKTAIRSFEQSLSKKESDSLKEKLNIIYSLVDKGVKKNLFKSNKASRMKSSLQKKATSLIG